jgi:hypothetical protein
VTNALLVAEARGRLSEAHAARLLALLAQLPVNIDQSPADTVAVHACARRHNLSAYQASYLVLAQQRALPSPPQTACSPRRRASLVSKSWVLGKRGVCRAWRVDDFTTHVI